MKRMAWTDVLYWLALPLVLLFALFPFVYAIASSFKRGNALFSSDFWPQTWSAANYVAVFAEQPFGQNLLNSVLVAGGVVLLSLSVSLLAAYALGRVTFRGRGLLMMTILGVSMFPQVAILSGLFELITWLGLYDSLWALVLSDLIFTLPFTVWVLVTFMRELPKELEEAALMDGAGVLTVIFRIFLPLLWPAVAATSLLAFIAAWNEFLFALTFTLSGEQRTVPVAIALISGASSYELPWGNIMAASVIVTVPLIVLVLIFQRHIVSGLTAGAVKG
ncbi:MULTISPECIES: carbohydrate ABC transporter permease [Vogesella]|uniref:Carbohydrate ABC transporter permease n=1 Tax=Vogesella indigofera TaxID=45465 RepID=A0ABT5I7L3_VOGIN|nr:MULTISPECIES: carbohydrate ABC transporter permease [Vogesella]MCQ4144894.1 carbohydrate ABC transporter permease [Vogesella sp. AC12]MDC7692166.1 carbohydrate ABC transporter permease [Vogesella indigofera]MDC7699315.1 carbohydrate ABC transporter permease [Vogesella indigofera]